MASLLRTIQRHFSRLSKDNQIFRRYIHVQRIKKVKTWRWIPIVAVTAAIAATYRYNRFDSMKMNASSSKDRNIKTMTCCGIKTALYENTLLPNIPNFVESSKWLKNNYVASENEIWIIAFTKCGTTLTQQICHEIMHCYYKKKGDAMDHIYYKDTFGHYGVNEWIECKRAMGSDGFDKYLQNTQNTKRIWKTHASLQYLPCKQLPKKIIILCRNPKDTMVSYYYHVKNTTNPKVYNFVGGFDEMFMIWSLGLIENNSYFSYYAEYWNFYKKHAMDNNIDILWINYEDYVKNDNSKRQQISKIIKFMDVDDLVNRREDIEHIMINSSVDKMKKQYNNYMERTVIGKIILIYYKIN